MRDHDTGTHRTELLCKRVGADKRDIHKGGVKLDLLGHFDELGRRLVRADHDDRVRLDLPDGQQRGLDGYRIALEGSFPRQLHLSLVERLLDAGKACLTEGIVLVHDRNPGDAEVLGQMFDHGFGFLEVAGANIHHQGLVGFPQELGARKGSDEGGACRGRDRLGGGCRRRANRTGDREHLVFLKQLLDRFNRLGRLVSVVDALEFEFPSLDATGLVYFGEGRFETHFHALSQRRCGAFKRRCLTKHDLVGRDPIFRGCRKSSRQQGR